jgi:AAA15 family ATPase/GTPase
MFKDITLKNFRTHKLTKIELHPITLFIGNNNSGKTNFLAGIQHFSRLVRRGRPDHFDRIVIAVISINGTLVFGSYRINAMMQRNIAIVGDGATDRAIFKRIVEVIEELAIAIFGQMAIALNIKTLISAHN